VLSTVKVFFEHVRFRVFAIFGYSHGSICDCLFFSHLPSFADCLLTLSTVIRRKHITDRKTLDFTPFRFCWLREIVARKYRLSRSRTFSCLKTAVQIVTINSLFETLPFLRDFSISRVDSFVVSISRHCRLNRSVGIRVYFPSKSDYRSNHEIALPRSKSVRDSSRKFFFLLSFISLDWGWTRINSVPFLCLVHQSWFIRLWLRRTIAFPKTKIQQTCSQRESLLHFRLRRTSSVYKHLAFPLCVSLVTRAERPSARQICPRRDFLERDRVTPRWHRCGE